MHNKIASFQVNHTKLLPGIYLSRVDKIGNSKAYTYDIRMLKPNKEPVLDTSAIHTLEHLGATFLRTCQSEVPVVYFGPMGCRTGFYLITGCELSENIRYNLIKNMFEWILNYKGKVPGASPKECGNYLDLNLHMAKYHAHVFYQKLLKFNTKNFNYPK